MRLLCSVALDIVAVGGYDNPITYLDHGFQVVLLYTTAGGGRYDATVHRSVQLGTNLQVRA